MHKLKSWLIFESPYPVKYMMYLNLDNCVAADRPCAKREYKMTKVVQRLEDFAIVG
tara:strand:+ start:15805 stop:15972 length:168 start_codon:yes stop_codon:yes gene_type:complete